MRILISVTSVLLLTGLVFAKTLEETFKKIIPVEQAFLLSLENRNGSIDVRTWDKEQIEIFAYKKVKADDSETAQRMMDELEIVIKNRGDEVIVLTEYPNRRSRARGGFWGWLMGGNGNYGYSVSYEIRVPEKFDLNVESTNGNIEIADCSGRLRLETTNGKIVANDVTGAIRCKTTNGSVRARFIEVYQDEDMDFISTNGSIRLYMPADINAEINAKTTNGSIRCDFPLYERSRKSRKHLNAVINDGGPVFYMKTTNGSIDIMEM